MESDDGRPLNGPVRSAIGDRGMNWTDRITISQAVLTGKPVIRGTRLAVDFIVGLLAQDWSEAEIIRNYPGITHADIAACLKTVS